MDQIHLDYLLDEVRTETRKRLENEARLDKIEVLEERLDRLENAFERHKDDDEIHNEPY